MNSKFKSYNSKFLLAGLVSLAPMAADAKTAAENETDTVAADKEMVNVAYRKVAKGDILGGVSVVDVEGLMKKTTTLIALTTCRATWVVGMATLSGVWMLTMQDTWYW